MTDPNSPIDPNAEPKEPNAEPNGKPGDPNPKAGNGEGGQGGQKTFTREELAKIVSAQVEEAQKKIVADQQAKTQKLIEEARQKAAEEAKMSAEQLAAKRRQEEDQQRELDRKKLEHDRLEFSAERKLAENKLPTTFSRFVVGKDEDETSKNVQNLNQLFKDAVSQGVKEKLAGRVDPATGAAGGADPNANLSGLSFDEILEKQAKGEITEEQALVAVKNLKI